MALIRRNHRLLKSQLMAVVLNVTELRMKMLVNYCFNLYMVWCYISNRQNYIYVYFILSEKTPNHDYSFTVYQGYHA